MTHNNQHYTTVFSVLLAIILFMSACSSSKNSEQLNQVELPVDSLYNDALDSVYSGNPKEAASLFEEVERQHPYSSWAVKAQIMAAWAYYEANDYSRALVSLERFIELYPAHEDVEYAYYLRGLCYYQQIVDVERDAAMTQRSMDAFQELLRRFPNGTYAQDSQLKLDLASSNLAGKEMAVGRFYLRQGYMSAAINRFQKVTDNYQTSNQVPEALYRLTVTYNAMNLREEAERTLKVAQYNFPVSSWTKKAESVMGIISDDSTTSENSGFVGRMFNRINIFK
ncbi:outer membrane protein assembly factor BamD [Alphaproteobacteria bacterium]|nr:outer membrane protein assembly factor BamD [Alphaproteobacteria bacterium]MDC0394521.1 outer membrane protein assembly factor BamD [Alphaproteobacteria bacterium]